MKNPYYLIDDCPQTVVTLSGKMHEAFYPGQCILLVNRETQNYGLRLVERVVDAGNGTCVLDLRWAFFH